MYVCITSATTQYYNITVKFHKTTEIGLWGYNATSFGVIYEET